MTGCNGMPARQVIIHGDCWPVVNAVAHLSRAVLPGCECETTYTLPELLQQLHRKPEATLVLCLRPREHIFLFYALKEVLLYHPALVISDELLFSDRVVLHNWGELPAVLHQELTAMVAQIRQHEKLSRVKNRLTSFLTDPKPATGLFAVPLIFNHPTRLMNYMTLLMLRATVNCGVTPDQQKLLEEVYKGLSSLSEMTTVLNKNEKQIWQDKNRLLVKLGMKNRLYELFYGTRLCESRQLTPFMMPGDVKQDHSKLAL
ncbi:transcriptional regulator [Salmonella enterica subsp. enterica]|uniref:Transcriptional regulator n=2 Tax=Salmonella enterica TaxID=28901 RepID=A0A744QJA3_SALER|nr:transcriptional regulator [Salmonella enterica subsp. enterica serovar Aqua]ECH1172534.1 transcriptional regulator [Salmonella enterica subsp. enterica serovar Aqua]HAF2609398.1 transcriptional regulator [Salmonella enterica]